ncbi:MAG: leucine zipper domain-containing protein [Sphingomonas sp.]|jgi:hypothetical protein
MNVHKNARTTPHSRAELVRRVLVERQSPMSVAYHCTLLVLGLYSPLCCARHKGLCADRQTMPSGLGFASSANVLATIGAT